MASRRIAPSAPPARPAVGPSFRAGERVRVVAGLSTGSEGVIVGASKHYFGDLPTFEVELPFFGVRVIRADFLQRVS